MPNFETCHMSRRRHKLNTPGTREGRHRGQNLSNCQKCPRTKPRRSPKSHLRRVDSLIFKGPRLSQAWSQKLPCHHFSFYLRGWRWEYWGALKDSPKWNECQRRSSQYNSSYSILALGPSGKSLTYFKALSFPTNKSSRAAFLQ